MTLAPDGRLELELSGGGCACCAAPAADATAPAHDHADAARELPAHAAEFAVEGMTCGNCVRHVTEELGAVFGVDSVDVELVAGGVSTVTVRSAAPVDAAVIAAAVVEAGYEVAAR